LLSLENIDVSFGDVRVLYSVSLTVNEKEIVTLVGANGAGKSTVMNTISGILRPQEGRINFIGMRLDEKNTNSIVEEGIIQVPEGRRIFSSLTVLENLELGSYISKAKRRRKDSLKGVYELFPILQQRKDQLAGTLSGGEQQMLAIGRGIMGMPKLLMLDEPSLGLAPIVVMRIFEAISKINSQGTTILIVEQNVEHSLNMADRGYVLESGAIVLEGTGRGILENPHVKAAYLGI
jgi:branched-chain amino acid transport system ATP-binding protein